MVPRVPGVLFRGPRPKFSYELMAQFEAEEGVRFETVIFSRCDLAFTAPIGSHADFDLRSWYTVWGASPPAGPPKHPTFPVPRAHHLSMRRVLFGGPHHNPMPLLVSRPS